MDKEQAVKICKSWFTYLDREKARATMLQKAASIARKGDQAEARRMMAQWDSKPVCYDGATLLPAVKFLVQLAEGE